MAEIDPLQIQATASGIQVTWLGGLTFAGAVMGYFIKKFDRKMDAHEDKIDHREKEHARLELKLAENYATKDSLRVMFEETQNTNRETAARLEKSIDETKTGVNQLNSKMDNILMQVRHER